MPFQKGNTPWNKGKKCTYALGNQHAKGNHPKTQFKKGQPKPKNAYSFPKGSNNPTWKGRVTDSNGYIIICKPDHPFCSSQNYVFEHRLAVESQIKRYLQPCESTHHTNSIKNDNRIENLMAFTSDSAHQRFHNNPNNVKPSEIIFDGRKS